MLRHFFYSKVTCFLGFYLGFIQVTFAVGQLSVDRQYEFNPWFLSAHEEVKYCFDFPATGFSVPVEEIKKSFIQALEFWHRELENNKNDELKINSDKWTEVDCENPNLDFSIVFNWSHLPSSLRSSFSHLKDESSLLIRSKYDPENLKAEGLLYIQKDTDSGLPDQFWSKNRNLYFLMIHQLGYVFGYHGPRWGIHDQDFIKKLSTNQIPSYLNPPPTLLSQIVEFQFCDREKVSEFTKIPSQFKEPCLQLKGPNAEGMYFLFLKDLNSAAAKDLGYLKFNKEFHQKTKNQIELILPSEQKLFSKKWKHLEGPGIPFFEGSGQYFKTEKKGQDIYLLISPLELKIISLKKKERQFMFSFNVEDLFVTSEQKRNPSTRGDRRKAEIYIKERNPEKAQKFLEELLQQPQE